MSEAKVDPHPLKLFAGGVPPLGLFDANIYYLNQIIERCTHEAKDDDPTSLAAADVCLIALVAHFEAFSKDTFSAVVNICPQVLQSFAEKRKQDTVLLSDLVQMDFDTKTIGFLVAERRDFGDLKAVNSLFFDLVGITPFSKRKIEHINELLDMRNLLVHHGGVYTSDYAKRHSLPTSEQFQLFFHSPKFDVSDFRHAAEFLMEMAKKLTKVCRDKLERLIEDEGWELALYRKRALKLFTEDVDSGWEDVAKAIEEDFA
jgi:hypothetical protein